MNQHAYQFSRQQLGQLQCGVVRPSDPNQKITSLSVFCHGFGAGGDDLVGLAGELLQGAQTDSAMMVFPAAPLSLDEAGMPGGRAWWMLSIQRLMDALEDGRYEQVREEVPEGIDDAREKLCGVIEAAMTIAEVDERRLLLGGFSQGAMLSVDTALRGLATPPAKLCLFSGCLICEREWKPHASKLREVEIFQSHGRLDPILPLQTGLWLTEMLRDGGCTVDLHQFDGAHTIPQEAIESTARILANLAAS